MADVNAFPDWGAISAEGVAARLPGLFGWIISFAVSQQHEATRFKFFGHAPFFLQLLSLRRGKGRLSAGNDTGSQAKLRCLQHHILRTAESVRNAV